MNPDYKIVAIDETKYWNLPEYPEIKSIWTCYLTDFNEETFCCELTPSYWLEPVSYFLEYTEEFNEKLYNTPALSESIENKRDEIEDIVMSNFDMSGIYIHCHEVKNTKFMKIVDYKLPEETLQAIKVGDITHDDLLSGVYEDLAGNRPYIEKEKLIL